MTPSDNRRSEDEFNIAEFFAPLMAQWQRIVLGAALAAVVAGGLGLLFVYQEPSRWVAAIGFRPTFMGADQGTYPNGVPFLTTDIVNDTILDEVFDKNQVQDFCSRDAFEAAFAAIESSPELDFLDNDYQQRLSDARLSSVDRQRLQDEYNAKRLAVQRQYELTFVRPAACAGLPQVVVFKALTEVLQTWADDSERRRGVMRLMTVMLTPSVFDFNAAEQSSQLVHADLVRSAISRVIDNIQAVEKVPGAQVSRAGQSIPSLAEIQAKMEDLRQARLDPLVAVAGRGLGAESVAWVENSLQVTQTQQQQAEATANAYLKALNEYLGASTTPGQENSGPRQPAPGEAPVVSPQIDRSFIDRILEMSPASVLFRQEMTRKFVDASVIAISDAAIVGHYQQLLKTLTSGGGTSLPTAEVTKRLDSIVEDAKALTVQFDGAYEAVSRDTLRVGPLMYRVQRAPYSTTARAFGAHDVVEVAAAVFFAMLLLLALVVLFRAWLLRIRRAPSQA